MNRGVDAAEQLGRRDALAQRGFIDVVNGPGKIAEELLEANEEQREVRHVGGKRRQDLQASDDQRTGEEADLQRQAFGDTR